MMAVTEAQATETRGAAMLERLHGRMRKPAAGWAARRQSAAFEYFAEHGYPDLKTEGWRHTSMAAMAAITAAPAALQARDIAAVEQSLRRHPLAAMAMPRLVLLNGRLVAELSSGAPELAKSGVRAHSLREAWSGQGLAGLAEQHWARYAGYQGHALIALNTALTEDGAMIEFASAAAAPPLLLVHAVSAGAQEEPALHVNRALIAVQPGARASVIELFVSLTPAAYAINAVTEIVAGEDASVDHYKVGHESDLALHFGAVQANLSRRARYRSHAILLGGARVRNEAICVLDGEGAECLLNGLYTASGRQHLDNFTRLDHAQPHGTSREFYKGILAGEGVGVFSGRIVVRPGAQRTDAIQSNRNLLLSPRASLRAAEPQLEIYADDVRCTHGATVGQLDPEALFYLRSRGLDGESARRLLTYAFANEILQQIQVDELRRPLENELFSRWTGHGGH